MAVVRRRLVVAGRVQGVFYRASCQREAQRLGVAGWAKNLDDGRVEVVMEGEPGAVADLESWCRGGPPRALITSVTARDEAPEALTRFVTR